GTTGFLCHTVEDCVEAVKNIPMISRQACRNHVAVNFGVERMVDGYEAVYRQLVQNEHLSRQTRYAQDSLEFIQTSAPIVEHLKQVAMVEDFPSS
ncbi:MAG: hypothetical protein WBA57_12390, partial [Elainellaceae cyanobacterium]